MRTAVLYWNQKEGHSNLAAKDENGNIIFEREISKGDQGDGWFAIRPTIEEVSEYLDQVGIEADEIEICDSY